MPAPGLPIQISSEDLDDLTETYQRLHAAPELSLQEERTAAYISDRLARADLNVYTCGGTGRVAVLTNGQGPVVAYRADMDGLPVLEATGLPYASTATGWLDGAEVPVMHACGHDVHMAVAIKTAEVMAANRGLWSGTLVFIFQPAEETAAGARAMVADRLWEIAPRPAVVLGQHVMPYEAGKVYFPIGPAMSMADSFRVTVFGKGAHGSQPDQGIDPIVLGSSIVLRLQTIVSREVNPRETAVVTVGTFHAGLKENIIPEHAELTVNIRTFSPTVRAQVLAAVERILEGEAAAAGAPAPRIEPISSFPPCTNDPEATRQIIAGVSTWLGEDATLECDPHMASEDFGHLGDAIGVPTVYWFLGGSDQCGRAEDSQAPVNHSPHFAPDPDPTLKTGLYAALAAVWSRLASPPAETKGMEPERTWQPNPQDLPELCAETRAP